MNSLTRHNAQALAAAQFAYDNAEPSVAWIDTIQGKQYLQEGIRTLLLGHDTSTVKAADFIVEFSVARNDLDAKDESFSLDWVLARGGIAPREYEELANSIAYEMLYAKRDIAEQQTAWLRA